MRDGDTEKLREYFKKLNLSQKKEFINNLKDRIAHIPNSKYAAFLAECAKTVEMHSKPDTSPPDISEEAFAKALASFLGTRQKPSVTAIAQKLQGRWQREAHGKVFYYHFKADNTFETNEIPGHSILYGHYNAGIDDTLLIEPHDLVQFSSLMFSGDGSVLTVGLPDGTLVEYTLC